MIRSVVTLAFLDPAAVDLQKSASIALILFYSITILVHNKVVGHYAFVDGNC